MQNNIPAVLEIIRFIYENIMYAELNTKSDYCQQCGYSGEIQDRGRRWETGMGMPGMWKPRPGSTMNVARRTCGYIGSQYLESGQDAGNKRTCFTSVTG